MLFAEDGLSFDVRANAEKETVWLTQAEMAELFDVNVDTIGLHLRNIYRSGELESSTYEESSVVRFEGSRQAKRTIRIYDSDAIIAVGYRVNSRKTWTSPRCPFQSGRNTSLWRANYTLAMKK